MEVLYIPNGNRVLVRKVRKNGEIELVNGMIISKEEFQKNWKFVQQSKQ